MAAKELLDNVSACILRTNPKITTNVKIVVDTSNNIYLESFDANDELAKLKYKAFKVGRETSYEYDLRAFYQGGTTPTPSSIAFDLARKYSDNNIYSDYGKQFEFMYNYGAEAIPSKFYTEEFGILAPLWLDKIIPDYFIIFRVDEPISVSNKNATTEDQYKAIVENPNYFKELILKKSTIIKTYDLTEKSQIGQYIRNYFKKPGFPDSPFIFNSDRESQSFYRGIDISKGGFVEAAEWLYKDFIGKDKTIIENDYFITSGFERNNVAVANLLNLQFLFNDNDTADWNINRYFGLYVNAIQEGSFRVSGSAMLADVRNESEQLSDIDIDNTIEEYNAKNIIQTNSNGVIIYMNPDTVDVVYDVDLTLNQTSLDYVPTSLDVDELDSIFYVQDKNGDFHNLKIDGNFDNGKLRLADTSINWKNFTGFNDLITSQRAYVSDKGGKANIVLKVNSNPPLGDRMFVTLPVKQVYQFMPSNIVPGEKFVITDSDGHSIWVNAITTSASELCENLKTKWHLSYDSDFQNYTVFVKDGTLLVREKVFTGIDNNFTVQVVDNWPGPPTPTPGFSEFTVEKIDSAKLANWTIIANDTIATEVGKAYQHYFNQNGTVQEVANSIAAALNNIRNRLFEAVAIDDLVIILSKFAGSRFNSFMFGYDRFLSTGQITVYAESIGLDNDEWYIRNFDGGIKNTKSKVSISADAFNQFNEPNRYLRSSLTINQGIELDYVKIKRVSYYVDEPIRDVNGVLKGFKNLYDLCTVICDEDKSIYLDSMNNVHLYDLHNVRFGRFSMFPIKDLDFDFHSTEYGNEKELIVEKSFYEEFGTTGLDLTHPDIEDWVKNNEYCGLIKVLELDDVDFGIESPKIDTEYDRLQENYIKELSTPSRVVPFINKWVYNNGKDVRENDYRLNVSEAFGTYNFSPSGETLGRDQNAFTHEWFYLQKLPPYYGLYDASELDRVFSYFNDYIEIENGIKSTSNDYFKEYFVVDELILPYVDYSGTSIYDALNNATQLNSNVRQIKRQLRYSIFNDGSTEAFPETFFRGIKVFIKERVENLKQLNFNANKLQYKKSSKYNGYRFSAVLVPHTGEYEGVKKKNIDIDVIENKKFKTITLVVYVNIEDPLTFNGRYIDRTTLYGLNSKYDTIDTTQLPTSGVSEYADIKLSGAIDFTKRTLSSNTVLLGSIADENGNEPAFLEEIRPNEMGSFNEVQWNTWFYMNKLTPIEIKSNYEILFLEDGTFIYDDGASVIEIQASNCVYKNGGYTFWVNRLENICYAEIARMINEGSSIINYITIDETGSTTFNNFVIELKTGSTIAKPQYLKPSIDENKPVVFNLEKNIGYELDIQDTAYITPVIRHNGKYKPKFRDIVNFIDLKRILPMKFSQTSIDVYNKKREYTRYCNTIFKIDESFGKIENLYYHKINEINNNGILELTDSGTYQPLYPLIGEIGIDKKDQYLFASNWDSGYYKRSLDKLKSNNAIGTRNINEMKSFAASKIMKISDRVEIETFNPIQANSLDELDSIGIDVLKPENQYNLVYFNDTDIIYIDLYVDKRVIDELSNLGVYSYFENYISSTFGYGKQDSLTDDVNGYLQNNILPRYILGRLKLYVGKSNDSNYNNTNPLINCTIDDATKVQKGMKIEENYRFIKLDANNNFNIRVIYNKMKGYYYSIGPSIEILKK